MQLLPAGLALALLAAVPALAQDDLVKTATATMTSADGTALGTVTLTTTPAGVLFHGELRDLPAGPHGFHVHQTGACEPPFESAGDHYNPSLAEHGFMNEAGPHPGDMTNIVVPADGNVTIELLNTFLVLDTNLFDDDGAAVLVHAMPDDYATQPSGHAGDRIACGVIQPD